MALWTPANLSVAPRLVLDGEAVPWSGSNFANTPNSGSIGGTWNACDGTVVKGALRNGFNTLSFNGARNVKLSLAAAWTGDPCFFAVLQNVVAADGGLCGHSWPFDTSGWAAYPRVANAGGQSWFTTWNAGDTLAFGSGADMSAGGTGNWAAATTPLSSGSGPHIFVGRAGVTGLQRVDGTIETEPARTNSRASATDTGPFLDYYVGSTWELAHGITEYGNFQLAYFLAGTGFTNDDIERLEGWAAHRYALTALLPAGHPYKSTAPTFGADATGILNTTEAKDTALFNGSIVEVLGAVYLDPAKLGPTITLANVNLRATQTAAATGNARATAHHSSGNYYYEFTPNVVGNMQVGLCADALPLTEYLGQNSLVSIGVDEVSGWLGAGGITTAPALIANHTYGMATRLDGAGGGQAWCKDITAGGNWNANPTADPVTGIGGATFFVTTPNVPPTITSGTSVSIPENTTAVMTVTATDTG